MYWLIKYIWNISICYCSSSWVTLPMGGSDFLPSDSSLGHVTDLGLQNTKPRGSFKPACLCSLLSVANHRYWLWLPWWFRTVKHLPTMRETWVQSLGREDLLEKEMATYSSILAWKIPGMRSLVGYSPWGRRESDTTEWLNFLSFCLDLEQKDDGVEPQPIHNQHVMVVKNKSWLW